MQPTECILPQKRVWQDPIAPRRTNPHLQSNKLGPGATHMQPWPPAKVLYKHRLAVTATAAICNPTAKPGSSSCSTFSTHQANSLESTPLSLHIIRAQAATLMLTCCKQNHKVRLQHTTTRAHTACDTVHITLEKGTKAAMGPVCGSAANNHTR